MSRFESKKLGGFYPLDERWLPLVANLFEPPSTKGRMLDPFAGEGAALEYLSAAWNSEPFSIEVDEERGRECQNKFGFANALIDDCYNVTVSQFCFPVVFNNPPYDTDDISGNLYGIRRAEYRALNYWWRALQPDGYHLFVCYAHHMSPAIFETLSNNATMMHIYRFPEPHLEKYTQILIVSQFQKKKSKPTPEWIMENTPKFVELGKNPERIRDISRGPIRGKYQIPTSRHVRHFLFVPRKLDENALKDMNHRFGAHTLREFSEITAPVKPPEIIKPIAQPRYGQLAVIMAAGMLDGIFIRHNDKNAVLRGSVQRLNIKVKEETDEDTSGRERKTEVFHNKPVSAIIVLTEDGEVFNITEHDKLVSFITDHRDELMEYFDRTYRPAYDMVINSFWGETYDTYKVRGKYPLLPTQEQVATALTEHFLTKNVAILVGEPAAGKTPMSISVVINLIRAQKELDSKSSKLNFIYERYGKNKLSALERGKPVIILCPAIMPLQWQSEFNAMYPDAQVALLKDAGDAEDLFRAAKNDPDHLHVGILSYESAKLGEGWIGASHVHRHYVREHETTRDGVHVSKIAIEKQACDPITGSTLLERKTRNGTLKPINPDRLNTRQFFYEGKVFDGYEDVVSADGNKKRQVKFIHAVNRRVTEAEYDMGYRHMCLPAFTQKRRFGLPKNGNGRVEYDEVEVKIEPKDTSTLKKVPFGELVVKPGKTRERTIIRKVFKRNMIPSDPIIDPWLAMQGVYCTTSSKRRSAIDKRMKDMKKKVYRVGDGDAELDKALKKLGISIYYRDIGELVPRPPRYPVAEYIAKRHKGEVGLLIIDEIHRTKGIDTDAGIASRILLQSCKKVLGLTGTLYGGVASSIYAIEFAFNPRVRERFPWIGGFPIHWVSVMGTIEERWRTAASYSNGVFSGYKRVQITSGKESPGCSPLLVRELMDHCVFVGLQDLGGVMPDFSEIPEETEMDNAMSALYKQTYDKLRDYNKKCIMSGDGSFTASFYQNMLRLPDSMHRKNVVHHRPRLNKWDPKSERGDIIVMTVPPLGEYVKPKEERLAGLIRSKVGSGKRVIVYVSQTATRDIQDHIQKIITDNVEGARPFILRNVDSLNRVKWIQERVDEGYNVMIANPGLVTEGVNLIMFSTIIYIEIEASLTVMTQSSRRIWRLSQPEPKVEVYYLYYNDVFQSQLLFTIADKTAAANVLYGHEGSTLSGLSETVETFDDLTKLIQEGKAASREEIAARFNASAYNASEDYTRSSWFAPLRRDPEHYFGKKVEAKDYQEPSVDEEIEQPDSPSEKETGGQIDMFGFDFDF